MQVNQAGDDPLALAINHFGTRRDFGHGGGNQAIGQPQVARLVAPRRRVDDPAIFQDGQVHSCPP